jgi:hypothetical protein
LSNKNSRPAARILQFENKKYQEEDFIIPAQDTKGHSERVFCRVQPGIARDLRIIVQSRKFPFRTSGDVLRLATKLIVEMLQKMEAMPSVSGQVEAIIKVVRDEQFYQEFVATYEEVNKAVNRYIGAGEEGQARRLIMLVRDQINLMPKGYWKSKYGKELNQKFGYLMKGAGVDLSDGKDEEEE